MPTKFKRVPVIIDPPVEKVLSELSAVTGITKPTLIRNFLSESVPAFHTMLKLMKTVMGDRQNAMATLDKAALDAVHNLLDARQGFEQLKDNSNGHD